MENDIRLIAFYLPQFHPIEENDLWWGKGFTEWTNVSSAKPVFPGHYQPHIPADLGFYDLRLAEVREEQARMARKYGIYGFCYYYYYFNGKRLLNKPLDDVLKSGKPDFPFCICWANENWTRKWDGMDDDILIEQHHSSDDNKEFIRQALPVLKDKRYIRVKNRLLLLVYRAELLPEPEKTAEIWRNIVRKEIGEDLYLCAVNNFEKKLDPLHLGFDGVVQFPLDYTKDIQVNSKLFAAMHEMNSLDIQDHFFMNYPSLVNHLVHIRKPDFPFFRSVFPAWDNTPRRQKSSTIYINSSPEFYKLFLKTTIGLTLAEHSGDERLVFINAWNEWAEGAHLEPDKKHGLRFLQSTKEALTEENDYKILMNEINSLDSESRIFYSLVEQLQNKIVVSESKLTELTQIIDSQKVMHSNQLSVLTQKLEEKDFLLSQVVRHLEQKDNLVNEKETLIREKEYLIQEKEKQIQHKEVQFQDKEKLLQEREQQIAEQITRVISARNRIQELEQDSIQLESRLTEVIAKSDYLVSQVNDQEQVIQTLVRTIDDRELAINRQDKIIHEQSESIQHQTELIHDKSIEIQRLAKTTQDYITSYSWRITSPIRWLHSRIIALFYLFFPYGSKRWSIVKTMIRIISHPGLYIKMINKKTISNYFRVLSTYDLISYNKRIENQYQVIDKKHVFPPLEKFAPVSGKRLEYPEFSDPLIIFYYVKLGRDEDFYESVGSIIRHVSVPFKIVTNGDPDSASSDFFHNIDCVSAQDIPSYFLNYPTLKYVCLLDGDTIINPNTISSCMTTLDGDDAFLMVVPAVLDDQQMLHSAGIIIWNDGTCSPVGSGESVDKPEFLYLREVDSGENFAMIKQDVFDKWIHQQFMSPDFWTYSLHDLSMFIRKSTGKVIYQPQAQVTIKHYHVLEDAPGSVSIFYETWQDQLLGDHLSHKEENYFQARERGKGKQYLLMIDHYVPTFDKDAGSRSMKSYMELFIEHNIILKFIGDNFYPEEKYVTYFQQKGIEILYGGHCEHNWLQWLKEHGNWFDYVFISRPTIAVKYIDAIKEYTRAKILFYGHDLHYLREYRQYELEKNAELLEISNRTKEMESQLFKSVDAIYYPSQTEIDIIQKEFQIKGVARKIVLYIYDNFPKPDYRVGRRKDILFVGGFSHQPNCDAMNWFVDEIFPDIMRSIPDIHLYIAGSNPTEEITSKASKNISVTGLLTDEELKNLYKKCRIVIAPLRYGAGLKGKIVEAMYYGLPVVTTSIGFEGLEGAEDFITVVDSAEDFAHSVISLYHDEKALLARSTGSYDYVKANFSKENAYSIIQQDLDQKKSPVDTHISPILKILFISHDANLGGAQLLLLSMLRWLRVHTAIDFWVICNNGGALLDRFREVANTLVYADLEARYHSNREMESAILSFCGGKPDLIYGNTVAAGKSYRILKALQIPILTHVHELQRSIDYYASDVIDDVIRYSQFFIAASNAVAKNLMRSFQIELRKIKVIHAFVEDKPLTTVMSKSKTSLRKKLGLEESKFLIIGCGVGLFWRKGGDLFIEIAKQLKNLGLNDFHFYWIGSFDELDKKTDYGTWDDHLNFMKKNGLDSYITFLGRKANVNDYLQAGDLFLLPSREDPFPLVCLEAAQNSLPVICFNDAGGMPEFVEEDAGFVVPFEDTEAMACRIMRLFNDPNLLAQLGKRAKEKVASRHIVPIALPQVLSFCRKVSGTPPKVSIIVPNYNYGRFLEERLESIANQTFKDYELIILDDASEDNSREVINKYSTKHETQVLVNQTNSGSVFKQWYKGLLMATGDIIWMAESDDLSEPDFLKKMLPLLNDPQVNLAYCNSHVIDENGLVTRNYYLNTGWYDNLPNGNKWWNNYINDGRHEMNDGLAIRNIIPNANAVLFRKSSIMNINKEALFSFRCGGDWYIYINSILSGKVAYNSLPLNYHRRHKDSVVGRSTNSASETIPDYFKIHKFCIETGILKKETFDKQVEFVFNDLRGLWPDIKDEVYSGYYDIQELQRYFKNKKNPDKDVPTTTIQQG